ncbi:MAG: pilin [Candidatus Portnoybacteria bacterium]
MKKVSLVILNIFIFCFFFGLANNSLAYLEGTSPEVVSPEFEEEDVSLSPTLIWLSPWKIAVEEKIIIEHRWEIGTAIESKNMGYGTVVHPENSITLSDRLAPGTKYFWRVKTFVYDTDSYGEKRNLIDQSDWMEDGVFTTLELRVPTITWPRDGQQIDNSQLETSFKWQSVEEAELYFWELQGGQKKAGSTAQIEIRPGEDFKSLEYDTSYTFRVKACISCQGVECELCSGWDTNSFSTKPPEVLEKAELISPDDDIVSPHPTLKWEDVAGARFYKWQIKEVQSKKFVGEGWVTAPQTESKITQELPEIAGGYEWRINTCPERIEDDDCSGWSDKMTFLVSATAIDLSGNIEVSNTNVAPGESFTITIAGKSSEAVDRLSVAIYLQGNPSPIYYGSCDNTSTCTKEKSLSHDEEGEHTYFGRVIYQGHTSKTKSVKVTVKTTTPGGGGTGGGGECPEGQICNPLKYENFQDLISAINKFIFTIAIILSPILFIIAGIMLVTSAGDPAKVKKAQTMMIYTAVGLAIIVLAQALIAVLKNALGVKEAETYLPLLFSSLSLELKKTKVDKVFSQIKNIL